MKPIFARAAATYSAAESAQDASFSSLNFAERRRLPKEHCLRSIEQAAREICPHRGESSSPEDN
jgi:hypothetical protein